MPASEPTTAKSANGKRQPHQHARADRVDERHEQRRPHPRHQARRRSSPPRTESRSCTAPEAPSRLGESACASTKPPRVSEREEDARREDRAEDDARPCARAGGAAAAARPARRRRPRRICRIRIPVTLTHEDGSWPEARTAAIHWAARGVISSPRRTITLPRGILVNTLSTERPARRAPLRGQRRVVGQVGTQRGREERRDLRRARAPRTAESASFAETAAFASGRTRRRPASRRLDSRPEASSRTDPARARAPGARSRWSTTPPR